MKLTTRVRLLLRFHFLIRFHGVNRDNKVSFLMLQLNELQSSINWHAPYIQDAALCSGNLKYEAVCLYSVWYF
jgi:hypothetical protein